VDGGICTDSSEEVAARSGLFFSCSCADGFVGNGRIEVSGGAGCAEEATISSTLVNPINAETVVFELSSTAGIYASSLLILSPGGPNEEVVVVRFLGRIGTTGARRNVGVIDVETHLTLAMPTTHAHGANAVVTRDGAADLLAATNRKSGDARRTGPSTALVAAAASGGGLLLVAVLAIGAKCFGQQKSWSPSTEWQNTGSAAKVQSQAAAPSSGVLVCTSPY
jgi:hypothetical protein